jgi:hypothetical protein
MYIKPRQVQTHDGLMLANVYDPERRDRLPPEGRDVPDTPYWRRRVAEGGVEFATEPAAEVAWNKAIDTLASMDHRSPPLAQPKEDLQ